MFPLLAAYVLIQASLLNWISDGPNWTVMSAHVERCRVNWWATLLHIQNWIDPSNMVRFFIGSAIGTSDLGNLIDYYVLLLNNVAFGHSLS